MCLDDPKTRATIWGCLLLCGWLVVGPGGLVAEGIDPALLAGWEARAIGPAGPGGRVTAIAARPGDPDLFYVGSAGGGVWKTVNGGITLEPVFDSQEDHSIGALALGPGDPGVVWVGSGEGNPRNSVMAGHGVYKSLDGGRTWRHMGLEHSAHIPRLLLDPTEPDTVWVCALGPIWSAHPQRGVFRSRDGGESWQQVLGLDEGAGCGDLVLDPERPGHLLAALWQVRRWPWFFASGGPRSGLYRTVDGGESWLRLGVEEGLPGGAIGRVGLALAPSSPRVIYALVEAEVSVLLRSSDGGGTFERVNDHPQLAPRPFYFADLRVDPLDPDRLFSLEYSLKVSGDGGHSWSELAGAANDALHIDHQALWIHPGDPRLMIEGSDGGVALSRDRGQTFRQLGHLPLAQVYHLAVDTERPYNVYGGLQDNGTWRGPSSVWERGGIRNHHWREVGDGDGFDVAPDPRHPRQGYSMWQGGQLMRWNLDTGEMRSIRPPPTVGEPLRFNWNAAFALDPFADDTLYLGSQYVHRSKDRGETWEVISTDLTADDPAHQRQAESGGLTLDVTGAEGYSSLVALAPGPRTPGLLWAGSDDGRLHLSRDGGASWDRRDPAFPPEVPKGAWIPHIAPSPHDEAVAWVVLDDHRRGDPRPWVVTTRDHGASWQSLDLLGIRGHAQVIVEDVVAPGLLFLGTELGLWWSGDGGSSWWRWRHGLPSVSVTDLVIHPREHDLVIATHGRGFFVLDDIRPLRRLPSLVERAAPTYLELFDTPPAQQFWPATARGDYGYGAQVFSGTNRPYGALVSLWLDHPALPHPGDLTAGDDTADDAAGEEAPGSATRQPCGFPTTDPRSDDEQAALFRLRVELRDPRGNLLRTLHPPAHRGLVRFAWDLRREPFDRPPWKEIDWYAIEEGPEVPPGTYSLTVILEHEGEELRRVVGQVEVLADPRASNSQRDWQRRWSVALRHGELNDRAVAAICQIESRCTALEGVGEQVRRRLAAPEEGGGDAAPGNALATDASSLCSDLRRAAERLWISDRRRGLPAETDVMSRLWYAHVYNFSAWDPPSPSQLAYLDEVEQQLGGILSELDGLEVRLVVLRQRVEAEGLEWNEPGG